MRRMNTCEAVQLRKPVWCYQQVQLLFLRATLRFEQLSPLKFRLRKSSLSRLNTIIRKYRIESIPGRDFEPSTLRVGGRKWSATLTVRYLNQQSLQEV